jgi:hypothetical protein
MTVISAVSIGGQVVYLGIITADHLRRAIRDKERKYQQVWDLCADQDWRVDPLARFESFSEASMAMVDLLIRYKPLVYCLKKNNFRILPDADE